MIRGLWLMWLAVASVHPTAALGQDAPADTALTRFLGGLSDSTDRYFGQSAAPLDTAGLDSALVHGLAHPDAAPRRTQPRWSVHPEFWFNRVDGPVYGGGGSLGEAVGSGQLSADAMYAVGPGEWLGRGRYQKSLDRRGAAWDLDISGGLLTTVMDRERAEYGGFSTVRALVIGSDSRHYLRDEGFQAALQRETPLWRARVSYHDYEQSPLEVTASWNLTDQEMHPGFNLAAARGHLREFRFDVTSRIPLVPLVASIEHHTSGDGIGSDFEFRRWRSSLSGEVGLGREVSLVPQLSYGRLTGQPVPQAAFYLGGSRTLRSIEGSSLGGTGLAVARLDVISLRDFLETMGIPHPAAFPMQLGAFAASGAVWGDDPYGGPSRSGVDWPNEEEWKHEAGVQVLYRPGIPQTNGLLRFSYAWPLGPGDRPARYAISYSQPLDFVRVPGR